jgi:hypothetical protein
MYLKTILSKVISKVEPVTAAQQLSIKNPECNSNRKNDLVIGLEELDFTFRISPVVDKNIVERVIHNSGLLLNGVNL